MSESRSGGTPAAAAVAVALRRLRIIAEEFAPRTDLSAIDAADAGLAALVAENKRLREVVGAAPPGRETREPSGRWEAMYDEDQQGDRWTLVNHTTAARFTLPGDLTEHHVTQIRDALNRASVPAGPTPEGAKNG